MIKAERVEKTWLLLDNCIDNEIKTLLRKYLKEESDILYNSELVRTTRQNYIVGLCIVVIEISKYSINNISWENYCLLMQKLHSLEFRHKNPFKRYLDNVYNYIIENSMTETGNINDLKKHKYFLHINERKINTVKYMDACIKHEIVTNFPISSNFKTIYLVESLAKRYNTGETSTIINLNTDDEFVKELLINYIEWLKIDTSKTTPKVLCLTHRVFIYFFYESLLEALNRKTESITDINFDIYKKQYNFYKRLAKKYDIRYEGKSFTPILKEFYIFLLDYIEVNWIDHNVFYGTSINRDLLMKVNFNTWVSQGYIFTNRTGIEEIPKGDKWLLPDDSKASANKCEQGFDFSIIEDKQFKEDLKNWVWHTNNKTIPIICTYFRYIVEFINLKLKYDIDYKNVTTLGVGNDNEVFNAEFMFYFRTCVEKQYDNKGTRENIYKGIKSFLRYHKEEYHTSEQTLKYIAFKAEITYNPNPVDKNEWRKVSEIFKLNKDKSSDYELYYIIFNLKSTTHLRLGEILNLERNCIKEINSDDSNPSGVIEYYSKKSKGVLKPATLTLDKIRLIERAKEITEEIAKESCKYVFIRTEKIVKLKNSFQKTNIHKITGADFRQIFDKVQMQALDEIKYTPYNLRHMYKSQIWEQGTKKDLNILTLEKMTDSKYTTDRKHYRSKEGLLFYVEAIAGTTISDIDIVGNYIANNSYVNKLNPVQNGIGGCIEYGCKPVISDKFSKLKNLLETEDMCLICNNFKTCISRSVVFEERIYQTNLELEKAKTEYERDILINRQKIYSYYYTKLLELKEGVN